MDKKLRAIAIYLPQFHPISENDLWWGKGFTEWRNVAAARPRFRGHEQPHIPADLGFYDLRVRETRVQQAELARQYGIYGFCYYHYWFNGKRLLNQPSDDLISSGVPDFPFFYCWANENWSRRWDGKDNEVLISQRYSEADDVEHINHLVRVFKDSRYVKIQNKPVFAIYRAGDLPDPIRLQRLWDDVCREHGFDGIYLINMQSMGVTTAPESIGFNAAADFQPDFRLLPERTFFHSFRTGCHKIIRSGTHDKVVSYAAYIRNYFRNTVKSWLQYPCVFPRWDNSPRRKQGAVIFTDSEPQLYKDWLNHVCNGFIPPSEEENFIFINAWNEWAEGNHLEPCLRRGHQYLEATYDVLKKYV